MRKAVLFDMDGVLVDTERVYMALQKEMGEEMGVVFSDEELTKHIGISTVDMWNGLKATYAFDADAAQLAKAEHRRMDTHYESGCLYPIQPSIVLLRACCQNGLKVAVATSSKKAHAYSVVSRLEIAGSVDAIATSSDAGACKPAPDIFLLAARRLGVCPADCVVIEDSHSGVQAAKSAGMCVIGLKNELYDVDLSAADCVVRSCDELSVQQLRSFMEE